MSYQAKITLANPTCVLFLLDQSDQMSLERTHGVSHAAFAAAAIDRCIEQLWAGVSLNYPIESAHIRDYFHVGVISYGGHRVGSALGGDHSSSIIHKMSSLLASPVRTELRYEAALTGAGVLFSTYSKTVRRWIEPKADGYNPLSSGVTCASNALHEWCAAHSSSFPPTVIHITGRWADPVDLSQLSETVRSISTADGPCMAYTVSLSSLQRGYSFFPSDHDQQPDRNSAEMLNASSLLPARIVSNATKWGYQLAQGARGFILNGDPGLITRLIDVGTRKQVSPDLSFEDLVEEVYEYLKLEGPAHKGQIVHDLGLSQCTWLDAVNCRVGRERLYWDGRGWIAVPPDGPLSRKIAYKLKRDEERAADRLAEPALDAAATELFELLQTRQREVVRSRKLPRLFPVVPDQTLREVARKRPSTLSEVSNIAGMNELFLYFFGDAFLELINGDQ